MESYGYGAVGPTKNASPEQEPAITGATRALTRDLDSALELLSSLEARLDGVCTPAPPLVAVPKDERATQRSLLAGALYEFDAKVIALGTRLSNLLERLEI